MASLPTFGDEGGHDGIDALNKKGRGGGQVQYGMARQSRAYLTVLWQSLPVAGANITLSSGSIRGCYVATVCPCEGRWYQLVEEGISTRMGGVVSQDGVYTLELLHAMLEIYELERQKHGYSVPIVSIYLVMFLLVTCL